MHFSIKWSSFCWLILVLFFSGCGESSNGNGSDGDRDTDSIGDSDGHADSDANTDTAEPTCDDGVWNGDEEGVDCGGHCDNKNCCTNGVIDANLGEWAADCGGTCEACYTGTVYFVAADGDDANDGLDGTPQRAWRTIAHVNKQTFSPGDAVLFHSGDTWRETLILNSSGTAAAYITYGAYGDGDKPRILGSERVTGWTAVSGQTNIWQSDNTFIAPRERVSTGGATNHPASIFFGELDGRHTWGLMEDLDLNGQGAPLDIYECDEVGARFSLLDQEYDWCWQDDHIYVYAPDNPGTRYEFVEVPQRIAAIKQVAHPPQEYIAIDGLELLYLIKYGYDDGWPMNTVVRGLNVRNCHIGYVGTKGAASAMGLQIWHSDMLVESNEIHDCGRRNISYNVYGDVRDETLTFENVVFRGNELYHGFHTTGFDISGGYPDTFRNFAFIDNYLWDDPADDPANHPNDFTSMGIYLAGDVATFTDFKVYRNILKHIKQKGIIVGNVQNAQLFHNTVYSMNHQSGGDYRGMVTVSGDPANLLIQNNIFYGDVPAGPFVLSAITFSGTADADATLNNNLFFQVDASQRLVTTSGGSYQMDDWTSYLADTSWDAASPVPANPLFVDPENDDFSLQSASPAIDQGALLSGVNDGYDGDAPDLGAVESN